MGYYTLIQILKITYSVLIKSLSTTTNRLRSVVMNLILFKYENKYNYFFYQRQVWSVCISLTNNTFTRLQAILDNKQVN